MTRLYSKRIDNCCDCPNCREGHDSPFGPDWARCQWMNRQLWRGWGKTPAIVPPDGCPLPEVQEAQG